MATRAHLLSHGSRASLLVSRPCFSLFQLGAQSSSVARPISLSPARSSLSSPSPWFRASAPLARTQLGAIPSPCHAARFLPARPDHRSPSAWSSSPWPLPSPCSDPSARSFSPSRAPPSHRARPASRALAASSSLVVVCFSPYHGCRVLSPAMELPARALLTIANRGSLQLGLCSMPSAPSLLLALWLSPPRAPSPWRASVPWIPP
jgi:hypothetical protein